MRTEITPMGRRNSKTNSYIQNKKIMLAEKKKKGSLYTIKNDAFCKKNYGFQKKKKRNLWGRIDAVFLVKYA